MFLSLERTFGLLRVTYLMSYCAYIASSVAIQDVKDHVLGARQKVDTALRVLSAITNSCPGIQRSMDIIEQCLATVSSDPAPPSQTTQPQPDEEDSAVFDQMPTFPLNDFDFDFNAPINHALPFSSLEPFNTHWSGISETMFEDFAF